MSSRVTPPPPGFRSVPRTGVIFVMTEAMRLGYVPGNSEWANLGQGAPETGPLPGAPERLRSVQFSTEDLEYSPIDGLPALRDAVAELYNARYRKGHSSKYTRENVAISPGGRAGLTRMVSTLGRTNVGHFLPDYTAYEELLDSFGTFVPIPIMRSVERQYEFTAEDLRQEILGRGLAAVILSNPNNPTGSTIEGPVLADWVKVARELHCTLIFDEFYSHYRYDGGALSSSAAEFVEDVNKDPVVIIDGLTKNWRYPGFRVSWTVAPKPIIEAVASAGSFLEGGCARPMQLAAMPLLKREVADSEARAIQSIFKEKRELLLKGLADIGIAVDPKPRGAFYCWGDLSKLSGGLSDGMNFFRKALDVGVITVPGVFFDINPGQRRPDRPSRFNSFARFSFGPSREEIVRGIKKLKQL